MTPGDSQLDGDGAAGLQQIVLGREWALRRRQQIVVPSVDSEHDNGGDRCYRGDVKPHPVGAFAGRLQRNASS